MLRTNQRPSSLRAFVAGRSDDCVALKSVVYIYVQLQDFATQQAVHTKDVPSDTLRTWNWSPTHSVTLGPGSGPPPVGANVYLR